VSDLPRLATLPQDSEERSNEARARGLQPRSALVSLLLHLAVLAAILGLWRVAPLPEEPIVRVTLLADGPGAAGASGGNGGGGGEAPDAAPAPSAEASEAAPPEPKQLEPLPPEPSQPSTPTSTETPPVAAAAPTQAAEPLPPPPPRKPKPPRPHPAETAPAWAKSAPAPAPPVETPPHPPVLAAAPAAVPTPGTPGTGSGPGGQAGVGTGAQGAGHGAIGDGPLEGPGDDYLDRLRRWLSKYKHYPEAAQKQKQEGKLVVSFVIARDGTVSDPRIERSSGFPLLDEAALKMLRDASPVPPLPATFRGQRAAIALPVDYSIGFFDRLF